MFRDNTIGYIDSLYGDEHMYIKAIRARCPARLQKMQMSTVECKILSFLLKLIKANKVLELGTLVGCSTVWIADALHDSDGIVISVEKSLNNYNLAKENLKSFNNITLINADALNVLQEYQNSELFDAIFIDAKKSEYLQYLELSKKCLKTGGLLIADNALMVESNIQSEIFLGIDNFNKAIIADPQLNSIIMPTMAGLMVAIKI